jgi:hypothetical protein
MESISYVVLNPREPYGMPITPEASFGLEPFELNGKVQWLHSTASLFSKGFSITEPPLDFTPFSRHC